MNSSGILVAALSVVVSCSCAQQARVSWSAFTMGFAAASSSGQTVRAVAGQPFVGMTQGTGHRIQSGFLADTLFWKTIVGVQGEPVLPTAYALRQNYPNPFNPGTTIELDVPGSGFVSLKVYDMLGREVATLVNEQRTPGRYSIRWNAEGVASGVYFYRLRVNTFVDTKKLVVLR